MLALASAERRLVDRLAALLAHCTQLLHLTLKHAQVRSSRLKEAYQKITGIVDAGLNVVPVVLCNVVEERNGRTGRLELLAELHEGLDEGDHIDELVRSES